MSRILLGVAGLNAMVLLGTFTIGFLSEGRAHVRPDELLTAPQQLFTFHLLGGLASAILSLLLHSLIFTYFIGTGRWVQEVVKAYGLPASIWENARGLKMRALPFILISIFLIITAACLGAATDRGLLNSNIHLITATAAIGFNFWSYLREYQFVVANNQIIAKVMSEVNRMRLERGLEVVPAE